MKSIYLIAISILFLISCKSTQAVAENSGNTEKKTVTEKKYFDSGTYNTKIESISMDANHSTGRVSIMEDKILVIQDTIKK